MAKTLKASELRSLPAPELRLKAEALTKELMAIRMKTKLGGIEKPHRIRLLKRDLARIATVARAQQLQETKAA